VTCGYMVIIARREDCDDEGIPRDEHLLVEPVYSHFPFSPEVALVV
jgi:hypothetical protein